MNRETIIEVMAREIERKRTSCADYDGDCYGIEDKVHCYLYDPTRGMCPFLSSHSKDVKETDQ